MTFAQHALRVALVTAGVSALLLSISARTEVLFADGLRYIRQAQQIEKGHWAAGLLQSVDHPVYPAAIAAAHQALGGTGPLAWQSAAQAVSVLNGILLVVPLYLVALELFGSRSAWLGCLLVFLSPLNSRVLADCLSESTFLLFWTWGLWTALRFLKHGAFGWLPVMTGLAGCAYLTRPEGLLLPAALMAVVGVIPLMRSTRLNRRRWLAAMAFLGLGPLLVIGPYVAIKGGLGTKPGIARVLGKAAPSPSHAVERSRPLDPNQTPVETYALAVKTVTEALRDGVSWPLVPFALIGAVGFARTNSHPRHRLLILAIVAPSFLALVRLHATGGYCTPRHALIVVTLFILAAAAGLDQVRGALRIPASWPGSHEVSWRPGPAVWLGLLVGYAAWSLPSLTQPLNAAAMGYRQAGLWLATHTSADAPVLDVTGWSQFYGERPGYTFANLVEASGDPRLRYVVARKAHLLGPWPYSEILRQLVGSHPPIARFPEQPAKGLSEVYVFDRQPALPRLVLSPGTP